MLATHLWICCGILVEACDDRTNKNAAETQRRSHVSPFPSRGKHSNGKSSGFFFLADDLLLDLPAYNWIFDE